MNRDRCGEGYAFESHHRRIRPGHIGDLTASDRDRPSQSACSRLVLQPRDLDTQSVDPLGNWGTLGVLGEILISHSWIVLYKDAPSATAFPTPIFGNERTGLVNEG
jgi:hypothetical protein